MLTLSQLYCNGMEREKAHKVIRFQNDYSASVQNRHPKRFSCGFVVQPAHLDDALAEIRRCAEELQLPLLCLPTHYLRPDGQWATTASPELQPIWELANSYGLAVEIHPYDGPKMIKLADHSWRFHLVWMCAQTADHYHFFTLDNFPAKYPQVRTCYAHGNQYGQVNVGRRSQGFTGRPDLFVNSTHPEESIGAKNVWFDTIVHDVLSFRLLLDRQGLDRIVAGLDDPYPLGEMESVPCCWPGKVIDEALSAGYIDEAGYQQIWNQNVVDWLYGEQKEKFYQRTGLRP